MFNYKTYKRILCLYGFQNRLRLFRLLEVINFNQLSYYNYQVHHENN